MSSPASAAVGTQISSPAAAAAAAAATGNTNVLTRLLLRTQISSPAAAAAAAGASWPQTSSPVATYSALY